MGAGEQESRGTQSQRAERPLVYPSGLCARKDPGKPQRGEWRGSCTGWIHTLPQKPGVKESCFLTILGACKREVCRPGG